MLPIKKYEHEKNLPDLVKKRGEWNPKKLERPY